MQDLILFIVTALILKVIPICGFWAHQWFHDWSRFRCLSTYPVPWNGKTVATGRSKANHCLRNSPPSTLVSIGGLIRRSIPAFAWSAEVPLAESPVRSTPPLLDEYNMTEPTVWPGNSSASKPNSLRTRWPTGFSNAIPEASACLCLASMGWSNRGILNSDFRSFKASHNPTTCRCVITKADGENPSSDNCRT